MLSKENILPTAVFFDFDGVIVDSVNIKTDAFRKLYEPYGDVISAQIVEHHLSHGGMTRNQKISHYHQHFLGQTLDPEETENLAAQFGNLVEEAVTKCPMIRGASECLAAFEGVIPLFVVSATPVGELVRIVKRRKLINFFESVHGAPNTKTEILRSLLKTHMLRSDECVMVGDSMEDYNAAQKTGIQFVGVDSGQRTAIFPKGSKIISDLSDFLSCLRRHPELQKITKSTHRAH